MLDTATYTGRNIDQPRSLAPRAGSAGPSSADGMLSEAQEVAQLLERCGVDLQSRLGAEFLKLATEQACDWAEKANQAPAPLGIKAAAVLGVRSAVSQVLAWCQSAHEDGDVTAIEDACLRLATVAERPAAAPEASSGRRRWGEGASPSRPERPAPLSSLD